MAQHFGQIDFKELLPSVLQNDETMKNSADAITPELKKSGWGIPQILLMSRLALASNKTMDDIGVLAPFKRLCQCRDVDLEKLNETELDLLAWQFHVDQYKAATTIDRKREMVANTIKRHRVKGTIGAVKGILQDVYGDCNPDILEWWQYDAAPYHFKVTLEIPDTGLSKDAIETIIALVTEYKNVRSWCSVFATTKSQNECKEYLAFASRVRTISKVALGQNSEADFPTNEYLAFATAGGRSDATVYMVQAKQPETPVSDVLATVGVTFTKAKIAWGETDE